MKRFLLLGGVAMAAAMSANAAYAQPAPQAAATASGSEAQPPGEPVTSAAASPEAQETTADATAPSTTTEVGEVIVTAQRRRERLEDVPASVTVISGQGLQQTGVSRFADLGNAVPGLQIGRVGVNTQPAIRGVSTGVTGIGQENNVAVYIDGFYQPDAFTINQDFANLADIQILKGPQGTLYGRNATGGALLIDTLDPGNQFAARGSVSYGSRNDIRLEGFVSIPIGDNLALSVAGYSRTNDGYIRDINNFGRPELLVNRLLFETGDDRAAPLENHSVRVKLRWQATDQLAITLGYNYNYIDDARAIAYSHSGRSTLVNATANFTGLRIANGRDQTSLNFRPHNIAEGDEWTLLGRYSLGDLGEVTSRTSYIARTSHQIYDFDMTPFDANSNDVYQSRNTFIQALDASLRPMPNVDLLVGAFYIRDDSSLDLQSAFGRNATTGLPIAPTVQIGQMDTEAYAIYGDVTWAATDRLSLTAGLRYSWEERSVRRENPIGRDLIALAGIAPSTEWDGLTARAIARYELAERTNIYASFSQGFKSGTYSTTGQSSVVEPETVNAYEIGFRRGGAIRVEAAAFYYQYSELQTGATIFINGASGQVLFNVPSATIYGAEFNIAATPLEGLNVRLGVAYTNARYGDFPAATGTGINTTTGFNISGQAQDWTGLRLMRAPDWTATAAVDYQFSLGGGVARLGASANYSSEYTPSSNSIFPQGTKNLRYEQESYAMLNANASWTEPSGRWTFGVFAENLTDTRYLLVSNGSVYGDYDMYNEPRTLGARISYRY